MIRLGGPLLTLLVMLAACGERDAASPQTPEQLARRVCELAKPAFDVVEADYARVGDTSVFVPLTKIEGHEGIWKGISMSSQFEGDTPADVLGKDVEGEPSATWTFDDLDLTCWAFDSAGSIQGVGFPGGWLVLRILKSEDGIEGPRGEKRYAVTSALIHATRIGDVTWVPTK